MATAAEDLHGEDPNADPNAKPGEGEAEGGEPESNGEDSPYAELAKEMGWVPKDKYEKDPETWKPAEQFIRDGYGIQAGYKRQIEGLERKLDTIARTSASIVEQQVKERVDELAAKYAKAVEDGDATEAFKLSGEIHSLKTGATSGAPQPSAEAQAFAERNKSWFNQPGNEYATARAVAITNELQAAGYTDHATQLRITEQRMRQEMPQLFGETRNGKPQAGVHQPGSRGSQIGNRAKGFSDMPKEAQDIARDMEARGVIKSKDDYAKNYFANLQGKA